jgi:preprotein translocase subunit SecE
MAKKQELEPKNLDGIKWSGIGLLWILFIVSYYAFTAVPFVFKIVTAVIIVAISITTLMTTIKGKSIVSFVKSAYVELQKVVWPTRKEAGQIALIVILVVLLTGLILWGVDSVIMWSIGKITLLTGE